MTFKQKWVLSIACGKSQEPLLRAARHLGYSIIAVDKSSSTELVDITIPLSTYATKEVLYELKKGDFPKFDAVICRASGPAVITANAVAEAYSLPTAGSLVSRCSVSKSFLHDYLPSLGLQTIPSFLVKPEGSKPEGWGEMVVKPSMPRFGKKNIFLISNDALYKKSIAAASKESIDGYALVQPFIRGRDIGLITLSQRGRLVWSTFFEEINSWAQDAINANGVSCLNKPLSQQQVNSTITSAKKIIAESNSSGFVFFSFRMNDREELMIYEINPGLCGDQVADILLPAMWPGADFFQMEVLTMAHRKVHPPKGSPNNVKVFDGIVTDLL